MQGYCLNCSNISKYVRGEFHGKIVKTVGIFWGQSNFLTITPYEWRLGKIFKQFFLKLITLTTHLFAQCHEISWVFLKASLMHVMH